MLQQFTVPENRISGSHRFEERLEGKLGIDSDLTLIWQMNKHIRLPIGSTHLLEERSVLAHSCQLHDLAELDFTPSSSHRARFQSVEELRCGVAKFGIVLL